MRELLDNAIDAGASSIDVPWRQEARGASASWTTAPGMDSEDLSLAWQPHATSKIESEDDLLRVTSLGFRGEALSQHCAVQQAFHHQLPRGEPMRRTGSRSTGDSRVAFEVAQGRPGTVVDVSELFFNYPARKKFLRSISAESGLCRSIFMDRAAAHPGIAFRLIN